jgi:hypothetical protein
MVRAVATIYLPHGTTFDTDSLMTATMWEEGTSTGQRGRGELFIPRQEKELLLVFKDGTHGRAIKGAEAQGVYDQLEAAEFPNLFSKWREPL